MFLKTYPILVALCASLLGCEETLYRDPGAMIDEDRASYAQAAGHSLVAEVSVVAAQPCEIVQPLPQPAEGACASSGLRWRESSVLTIEVLDFRDQELEGVGTVLVSGLQTETYARALAFVAPHEQPMQTSCGELTFGLASLASPKNFPPGGLTYEEAVDAALSAERGDVGAWPASQYLEGSVDQECE